MPDILDAAQNNQQGVSSSPPPPPADPASSMPPPPPPPTEPPPPPPPPMPEPPKPIEPTKPEEPLKPSGNAKVEEPPKSPEPAMPETASDSLIVPPPEKKQEEILAPSELKPSENEEKKPEKQTPPSPPPSEEMKPKKKKMGTMKKVTLILLLLVTLPLTVWGVKNTLNLFGYACSEETGYCRQIKANQIRKNSGGSTSSTSNTSGGTGGSTSVTTGQFGWNYSTNSNIVTTEDWSNSNNKNVEIAGTYIAPNGQRYVINNPDTIKAANDYNANNNGVLQNAGLPQFTTNTSGSDTTPGTTPGASPTPGSITIGNTTTYYSTAACALMNDEAKTACGFKPPESLTLVVKSNSDGSKTTFYYYKAEGGATITSSQTRSSDGTLLSSTSFEGTTYDFTNIANVSANANKPCTRTGTKDSCGSGLKCVPDFSSDLKGATTIEGGLTLHGTCGVVHGVPGTPIPFDITPIVAITGTQGKPFCTTGYPCPVGWTCDGDVVPGTAGTSFASKYCNPPPTSIVTIAGGGSTGGGGTNGGGNNPPTNPPPQCINIVAYKDGNALSPTELAALTVGDTITLAFAPGGAATKVRFQVNTGGWNETTQKNASSQFTWDYTLEDTTSFNVQAQWFDGSTWH